jgi:hypothetical protein
LSFQNSIFSANWYGPNQRGYGAILIFTRVLRKFGQIWILSPVKWNVHTIE